MFWTPSVRKRRGWASAYSAKTQTKPLSQMHTHTHGQQQSLYTLVEHKITDISSSCLPLPCFLFVFLRFTLFTTSPLLHRRTRQQGNKSAEATAIAVIVTVIAFKPFVKLRHDSWQLLCKAITCHKALEISWVRQRGGVGAARGQMIF